MLICFKFYFLEIQTVKLTLQNSEVGMKGTWEMTMIIIDLIKKA